MPLLKILTEPHNFKFYAGGRGYVSNSKTFGQKSIPYGNDRPGGDSGQPYIRTALPDSKGLSSEGLGISENVDSFFIDKKKPLIKLQKKAKDINLDNVIRGGVTSPILAFQDVERLTAYFFDKKNPSGIIFAAKQNALSRIAPKTEASTGLAYGLGTINAGIYTPLSTIAQAGVGFLGTHLNKQGLDPTGAIPFLDINKYGERVYRNNLSKNNILKPPTKGQERRASNLKARAKSKIDKISNNSYSTRKESRLRNKADKLDERADILTGGKGNFKNRLLEIWEDKQRNPTPAIGNGIIRKYSGGPGSFLGIGKTRIKFATTNDGKTPSRTGVNKFDPYLDGKNNVGYKNYGALWSPGGIDYRADKIYGEGASVAYIDSIYNTPFNPFSYDNKLRNNSYGRPNFYERSFLFKNKSKISFEFKDLNKIDKEEQFQPWAVENQTVATAGGNAPKALTQDEINEKTYKSFYRYTEQENKFLHPSYARTRQEETNSTTPGKFPKVRHEDRVNIGDPGKTRGSYRLITDKINGSKVNDPRLTNDPNKELNDFVQFRIKIIKGDETVKASNATQQSNVSELDGDRMKFRAFIDNMSDSFNSKWNSINYMGVGETLRKYQGFDRSLSLGFTVVALSQPEMFGMYEKLRYLASSITPTYSSVGYMTGNLIELTIGDYFKNQPGILESFTYDIPEEASWELKIGMGAEVGGELPMMIKVTGFKFTPIYTFRPEYSNRKLLAAGVPSSIPTTKLSNNNSPNSTVASAASPQAASTSNWYSNLENNASQFQTNQNLSQNILPSPDGLGLYGDSTMFNV
jgi:hypothetical protein